MNDQSETGSPFIYPTRYTIVVVIPVRARRADRCRALPWPGIAHFENRGESGHSRVNTPSYFFFCLLFFSGIPVRRSRALVNTREIVGMMVRS